MDNSVTIPFEGHGITLSEGSRVGGYEALEAVLCAAYAQAAVGKGAERHASTDPFTSQPIIAIGELLKSADGEIYQVMKKCREGLFMHRSGNSGACLKEMLGAINYIAGAALLVAQEAFLRDGEWPNMTPAPVKLTADEIAMVLALRKGEVSLATPIPATGAKPDLTAAWAGSVGVVCPKAGDIPSAEQFVVAMKRHGNLPALHRAMKAAGVKRIPASYFGMVLHTARHASEYVTGDSPMGEAEHVSYAIDCVRLWQMRERAAECGCAEDDCPDCNGG